MKTIFTILTLYFGLTLSAQTFEKTISFSGDEFPPLAIVENSSNYIFTINVQKSSNQYYSVLFKIDSTGQVTDSLVVDGYVDNPVAINDKLYLAKGWWSSDSLSLLKLDLNSFSFYDSLSVNNPMGQIVAYKMDYFFNCNCLVIAGGSIDSGGVSKNSLIQIDTSLNVIKEAYYRHWAGPFQYPNAPIFYDILENPSGNGFWVMAQDPLDSLSGWQGGTAAVIPVDSNLVRDSVNFRILYSSNHPSPVWSGYWGILAQPYSGIQLTDSTFIFTGRATLDKGNVNNFTIEDDMAYVITDDSLNDIRWEFWGGQKNQSSDSVEFSAVGNGISKQGDFAYIGYTSDFKFFYGSTNFFTLRKIDLQGNEIWTKHYSSPLTYQVYSVLATTDGGAIISGIVGDPNVPEKNVYILKVDSMGNTVTTSLDKNTGIVSPLNFKVYPNPAKDELKLLKLNQFKPYEFELYDTFGRLVKTVSWREDHQLVDVSSLASGIYVYRIIDEEGNLGSGKLMVE